MDNLPYCNELPYWRTSRTSPDTWIAKTTKLLEQFGAMGIGEQFTSIGGCAAYVVIFSFDGENYRIVWPVMKTRSKGEEAAARIQAATLMYHDCKAKAVTAKALGVRTAFVGKLVLTNGKTVEESSLPAIAEYVKPVAMLTDGTVEDA